MKNQTLACIVSLTMLMSHSESASQSILDMQRIESSKSRRHGPETKISEWIRRSATPLHAKEFEPQMTPHHKALRGGNDIQDSARIDWVRYLNSESTPGAATANDVAVDAAGNVFVTGKSESVEAALDIMTMKYDAFGDLLWTARYDGPVHGIDIGNAIAVDASGNVFVTGLSVGGDSAGFDYLTIKYNHDGAEQWVARYNGPANLSDGAVALELDENGNVYVTGSSAGSYDWGPRHDYATIKYNSSGAVQWVARYNGPLGWGEDKATALALDQWGNVYVTGSSQDTVGRGPWGSTIDELHYTTIKYTPQGAEAWVRRYDTADTADAIPTSIAVDDSGNVIVTGRNKTTYGYFYHNDILTVKYTSQGDQQWAVGRTCETYSHFRSAKLDLDRDGNVYVVAVTRGPGQDSIVTIKYMADGTEQWTAGFVGPFNTLEVAEVALDLVGNVYVAASKGQWGSDGFVGTDMLTLKYRNDGLLEWSRTYAAHGELSNRATAIATHTGTDSESDVIVVGGSGSFGFSTLRYDAAGNQRWAGQAGGERLCMDYVLYTEIDVQGNIYVVGEAQGPRNQIDYIVAKSSPAGVPLWSSRFNNPGEYPGNISDMAVDASGNVYLCGWVYDNSELRDYITVKFNNDGGEEWVARYTSLAGSSDDMAMGIGVDAIGNAYVTGLGTNASGWKMTTVKYDQTGNEVWVARSNDPGSGWDIVVDEAGSFYVGGITSSPPEFMPCFTVIKYDLEGTVLWVARDSSWSGSAVPTDMAVDDSGNVYLASVWETLKFDNAGRFLWDVTGGGNEIFFDTQQGVYLSSNWYGGIFKYSTNGAYQWGYNYSGMYDPDFTVDRQGNTFILGLDGRYTSPRLVCLSPLGEEMWETLYPAHGDEDVFPGQVDVDESGNVYVVCETGLGGSSRITLVKYNQVVVSVDDEPEPAPIGYTLSQNYPNPFNPSTTIQFSLPQSGLVSLKIYNTLGQEVTSLLEGERTAGVYKLEWNANGFASGVYFYQLKAGRYVETKKLLLLK